ncbi:MAG: hypothetical protein EXQ79_06945 [Acidimicrobiia bacterium]|nr:hypothetical protein [Acidimicrobiia bacterium]
MNRPMLALAIAATAAALAFSAFGGKAGAGPANVSLSPNPVVAGSTVTVNGYGPCNNGITPPPPGVPFDSTIEVRGPGNVLVASGTFPGGTSMGSVVVPPATAAGPYNVEVSCAMSLGNGVFFPTNPITITAASSPPVLIDNPPAGGGDHVPGSGTAGAGTAPAATPVVAVPNVTG